MDITHARKSAERFHKTTLLLASRVIGLSHDNFLEDFLSGYIKTLPVIVSDGKTLTTWFASKDGNAEDEDDDSITPYVVNGAFSLELHLKVLLYLEKNTWVSGHNLKELYDQLTQESKAMLTIIIREIGKRSKLHRNLAVGINVVSKVPFFWDIELLLEQSSEAFQNWRYGFQLTPGWFAGYMEIQHALSTRIKQLEDSD